MTRPPLLTALFSAALLLAAGLSAWTAPSSPVGGALDLGPLRKALAPMNSAGGLTYSSTVTSATGTGASDVSRQHLVVTAQRPQQFRIVLTQLAKGKPPRKYVIVSNGLKVWLYRQDTNRYSVTDYPAFQKSDNGSVVIGLALDLFYLTGTNASSPTTQLLTKMSDGARRAKLKEVNMRLTQQTQAVNGQPCILYTLADATDPKHGFLFYVNRRTNHLSRVQLPMSGSSIYEDYGQITGLAGVPKSTFVFVPPPHSACVAGIVVTP